MPKFAMFLAICLASCHPTAPIGSEVKGTTVIEGDKILVGTFRGGWFANTAGPNAFPPETRLKLIRAIETVSGCPVIRETMTGSNNAITAAVSC